VVQPEISKWV